VTSVLALFLALQAPAVPPGYRIAQTIPVPRTSSKAPEQLQLLEDYRLTDSVLTLIGDDAGEFPGGNCSPLCTAIATDTIRVALVRLVNTHGRKLGAFAIDEAIARMSVQYLHPDSQPTYFLASSYGGAYAHDVSPDLGQVSIGGSRLRSAPPRG
jgi:hypothetical protein